MEHPKTTKNVGQPCVICGQPADAQATIAALQDERDGWVRSREHYYQLWMRATDERDEMRKERDDFESQLTQRTAELEAAKRERDIWYARYNELSGVKDRQLNDLQAELERVRGQFADLRKMVAALPKVEGEISERFCTGSYYSSPYDYRSHVTFETALVALLKHRQGMEG